MNINIYYNNYSIIYINNLFNHMISFNVCYNNSHH